MLVFGYGLFLKTTFFLLITSSKTKLTVKIQIEDIETNGRKIIGMTTLD